MYFHWDGRTTWLFVASMIAGALNAVAGGGSFLSFPALLNVGVLPIQANATNTVALWPGQLTSIAAYFEDLKHNLRMVLPLSTAAVLGGVTGGVVLLHTGQHTFLQLVPWLLLIAALLFAVSTPLSRWLERRTHSASEASSRSHVLLFFGMMMVCFYIGYFGAGAGFLVIALLSLFGLENLNQINALKVVTTTLANGVAVVVFIVGKKVLWQHCLLMMLTAACGGYFGARFSRTVNQMVMRGVVVAIGLGMAAYFFWKQS